MGRNTACGNRSRSSYHSEAKYSKPEPDPALLAAHSMKLPVHAFDARAQVFEQRLIRDGSVHLQPAQRTAPISAGLMTAPRDAACKHSFVSGWYIPRGHEAWGVIGTAYETRLSVSVPPQHQTFQEHPATSMPPHRSAAERPALRSASRGRFDLAVHVVGRLHCKLDPGFWGR